MVIGDVVASDGDALGTYVPQLVQRLDLGVATDRRVSVDGTLVSADISGFTALSERLAALGHEGAEELTDLLNRCFTQMISVCDDVGGDVIKFGGDALLILLTGRDHAGRAAVAMTQMREIVTQRWSTDSVQRVDLGISQGAHTDRFHFSVIDGGHLELFVAGPAVTETVACEGDAKRGQILVSPATAELLPKAWVGPEVESGARVLRHRRIDDEARAGALIEADARPRPPAAGLARFLPPALVEQITVANPGEHRQVSVAFITVAGTDDLARGQGPDALHRAFVQVAANVRDVLSRHEVHWLASDAYENGGKIILTAGAPTATTADEDHLLLAVHELFAMDSPLPLRGGVNRGHVFVGDLGAPGRRTFTIMGDAVNLAARLMQKAAPGQAIASADMLARAQTTFDETPLEPFLVKGKTAPIHAAILGAPTDSAVDPMGSEADRDVEFIGREDIVAVLDQIAAGALAGQGCAIELVGEPGIGKSRIIREFVARHDQLPPIHLRGGQYARNTPYFVLRRLMRLILGAEIEASPDELGERLLRWAGDAAPELVQWTPLLAIVVGADVPMTPEVDRLADEFRRERLLQVVADAIDVAGRQPVILVAEDNYWFDEGSLEVLQILSRRASQRPWVIITTTRSGHDPALGGVDDARIVPVEAMDEEQTLALVEAAALAIDPHHGRRLGSLAERAGGHPLFALELVAAALSSDEGDELPESVESLVTTRIDRLAPADRVMLRESAVSGTVIDADVLASALGDGAFMDEDRWRALSDFVERETTEKYVFRQALYRDVAYQGLAYQRRREVHRRLGDEIERRSKRSPRAVAGLLAVHFDQARDVHRAWRYAVLAGDDARHGYANSEAITLYRRALANEAGASERIECADVAESLGDVLELTARYDEAFDAYQSGRSDVTEAWSESRLLRKIARIRQLQGNFAQSLGWLTRSMRSLERVDSDVQRSRGEAEVALVRAGTLHRQGKNREAARWAERAASAADHAEDALTQARAYNILEVAARTLGQPRATELAHRALELYDGSGDLVGEANVWNNLGIQAYYSGDWETAATSYERSRELRRQAGDIFGEALVANNLAELLSLQGHYDTAHQMASTSLQTWTSAGNRVGSAYARLNLGLITARSGDAGAGLAMIEAAGSQFGELGATALGHEARVREVEALLLADRPKDAAEVATTAWGALAGAHDGDDELAMQLEPLMVMADVRSGRLEAAGERWLALGSRSSGAGNTYVEALSLLALAELGDAGWDVGGAAEVTSARQNAATLLDALGMVRSPPVCR